MVLRKQNHTDSFPSHEVLEMGEVKQTFRDHLKGGKPMTQNQLGYANYVESARHNRVTEQETQRHNVVTENETQRHNVEGERETNRHNVITENEIQRHNVVTENETARHNVTVEDETNRHNLVTEKNEQIRNEINRIHYANQDYETAWKNRSDRAVADQNILLKSWEVDEQQRHNKSVEAETQRHNVEQESLQHSANNINFFNYVDKAANTRINQQNADTRAYQAETDRMSKAAKAATDAGNLLINALTRTASGVLRGGQR